MSDDARPKGWTEARALEFIAQSGASDFPETFAKLFTEGCWPEIDKEFPEFKAWVKRRDR